MVDLKEDGEGGMVGGSPTNNVGGGVIAGLGIGDAGEPGVDKGKGKKKKVMTFSDFIKRDLPK